MTNGVDPVVESSSALMSGQRPTAAGKVALKGEGYEVDRSATETVQKVTAEELSGVVIDVENIVRAVSETSLSFSVEEELNRMVVSVRAVGSDEIVRQFPPEEFLTVAKYLSAQNPEMMSEDFLKGLLFDEYS